MLKLVLNGVKVAIFALAVLMIGNWVRLGGRTLSDQVKRTMAKAESSDTFQNARRYAGDLVEDAKKGAALKNAAPEIPSSEKQKLRELIRELNGSADASDRR